MSTIDSDFPVLTGHAETLPDGSKRVIENGTEERFRSGTTMRSRKSNQSITSIGRPIAHYHNIKDPVSLLLGTTMNLRVTAGHYHDL